MKHLKKQKENPASKVLRIVGNAVIIRNVASIVDYNPLHVIFYAPMIKVHHRISGLITSMAEDEFLYKTM